MNKHIKIELSFIIKEFCLIKLKQKDVTNVNYMKKIKLKYKYLKAKLKLAT